MEKHEGNVDTYIKNKWKKCVYVSPFISSYKYIFFLFYFLHHVYRYIVIFFAEENVYVSNAFSVVGRTSGHVAVVHERDKKKKKDITSHRHAGAATARAGRPVHSLYSGIHVLLRACPTYCPLSSLFVW